MMDAQLKKSNDEKPDAKPAEFLGGSADARAHRRRSVLWPATLKVGRHDFTCQIWNMSLGGARVRIDVPLKDGAAVTLAIAGRGDIAAKVRWSDNRSAGLEFGIPPEEVRLLFMDSLQTLGLDNPAA